MKVDMPNKRQESEREVFKRIAEMSFERERRKRPCKYFIPNGAIEDLVKVIGTKEGKWIYVLAAANSVGKSAAAIAILESVIFGPANKYFDYPKLKNWKFPKKFWYMSELSTLKEFVCGSGIDGGTSEIVKWFPEGRYTMTKNGKDYYSSLTTDNGWLGTFKSYEMDVKMFESDKIGCIEKSQRVLLANGRYIPIGEIQVGDEVIAFGSRFAHGRAANHGKSRPKGQQTNKVVAKVEHENQKLFEIRCKSGYSIKCSDDHRFFIKGKGWTQAKDIIKGDRIYSPDVDVVGEDSVEPWKMAILGALIGDGCLRNGDIHFTCYNEVLLSDIKSILPNNFYLRQRMRNKSLKDHGMGEYFISSTTQKRNELKDWLSEIGVYGKLAHEKFIPDFVFEQTEQNKSEFLSRLYSTDGWVGQRVIGYASTSNRLAKDLQLLLKTMSIKAGIYYRKSKTENWRDQWYVLINRKEDIYKFSSLIRIIGKSSRQDDVNEFVGNRHTSSQVHKTHGYLIVDSVEPCGTGTTIDIQVEPNNNFVCEGFLAHNCAIFDEPPPKQIFNAVLARLTLGGIIIMPMTPLYSAAWVKDDLVDKSGDAGSPVFVLEASAEANCKTHGRHGRLDHAQIMALAEQYDPDDVEARLYGRFMHLAGVIFKGLHPDKHRHNIPPEKFTQDKYTIYQVLDPHDSKAPMAGWFAVDQYETVYVVDEYPKDKTPFHLLKKWKRTTKEMVQDFKDIEVANGWTKPIIRVIDPNFGNKPVREVGMTVAQYIHKVSLEISYPMSYITNVNDNLEQGHRAIRDYIALSADGFSRFFVGENCPNIWFHLTHYSIKENTGKALESKGLSEHVHEKYKDGVDVVRYFLQLIRRPSEETPIESIKSADEYMQKKVFAKIQNARKRDQRNLNNL